MTKFRIQTKTTASSIFLALSSVAVAAKTSDPRGNLRRRAMFVTEESTFGAAGGLGVASAPPPPSSPPRDNKGPGILMVNITEDSKYNGPWAEFTSSEHFAYQALSQYLLDDQTLTDIRSVYPTRMDEASGWMGTLDNQGEMNFVASQVSGHCDQACFDAVVTQLSVEVQNVSYVDLWYQRTEYMDNRLSYSIHSAMESAFTALSMSSVQQIIPNPPSSPNWLGIILDVTSFAAALAGPVGASDAVVDLLSISAATGSFVTSVENEGSSTASTANIDFKQNDMLDLQYSELLNNVTNTYNNLNAMAYNQAQAVAGNAGKLESFMKYIYAANVIPDKGDIDTFISKAADMFEYTSYQWLMNSKYGICEEKQVVGMTYPILNQNSWAASQGYIVNSLFTGTVLGTCANDAESSQPSCTAAGMDFEIISRPWCQTQIPSNGAAWWECNV